MDGNDALKAALGVTNNTMAGSPNFGGTAEDKANFVNNDLNASNMEQKVGIELTKRGNTLTIEGNTLKETYNAAQKEIVKVTKFYKEALAKAGENLATSNKDYQKLLEQERELTAQKKKYDEFLKLSNQNNEELSRVEKELLSGKKSELRAIEKKLAGISEEKTKMQIGEAAGLNKGGGGITAMIESAGTWLSTAVAGLAGTIGAQIGRYVLNKLDDFKEKVWNYNEKLREGAKITGNIFATSDRSATFASQDAVMVQLMHKMEESPLLKYYGMSKDAVAGIDTYARAYRSRYAGGIGEADATALEKNLEHLGSVAVATGLGFQKTLDEVTSASRRYNIEETASTNLLVWANDQEKKKGLAEMELVNNYKSLQSSLAMFGFNIYQSAGMADKFGKALQEGKIGLGDLVNYAKGVQGAGMGETYVMMEMAGRGKGGAANLIRKALSEYGGNVFGMIEWAKGFMQNDSVSKGRFKEGRGVSSDDFKRALFDAGMNLLPSGSDDATKLAMIRQMDKALNGALGVGGITNQEKMRELIELRGVLPKANIPEKEQEKTLGDIYSKLDSEIGPIERLDSNVDKIVNYMAEWVNQYRTERRADTYVDRMSSAMKSGDYKQAGSLLDEATVGARGVAALSREEQNKLGVGILEKIASDKSFDPNKNQGFLAEINNHYHFANDLTNLIGVITAMHDARANDTVRQALTGTLVKHMNKQTLKIKESKDAALEKEGKANVQSFVKSAVGQ